MVAIFIPSATISSPRCLRTTADCRPPYPPPNHTFLLPGSWIIRALVPSHAERNSACVSSTDHGHLAQYGCDGTHTGKEAGRGSQLVEPTSLSLPHPVVWLWICCIRLQLGQEGALYADRPHDIGSHNYGEEEQAPAVPHVVRRGMKQGVIRSQWLDKHKVLAVAIAPKEPLWEWERGSPSSLSASC